MKQNLDKLKKLKSYISNQFDKEEKKQYLVQVTIIEARELKGVDSTGTSDPFIKITVGNLSPQMTSVKEGATTVVFDQNFTFEGLKLTKIEFENFEILLEAYDYNNFSANQLIGSHSIGLSTLYRNANHELYNQWLPLYNPTSQGVQGHLLVSCYIINENDRPPVHEANEVYLDPIQDPFEGIPEEELTVEQQIKRREIKEKLDTVQRPVISEQPHQLLINIVKAEDLPIMFGSTCDSFISCRVGANVLPTPVMENSQKPVYQTRMMFPVQWPVLNDNIVFYLWDKVRFRSDIFIGQIPEFPSEISDLNLNFLQSQGGIVAYRWFNLYGVPKQERTSFFQSLIGKKGYLEGTQYFGRILLSLSLSRSDKPILGVKALGAFREPKIVKLMFRVQIYELQGTKNFGEYIQIVIKFGKYEIYSNRCKLKQQYQYNQQKSVQQQQTKSKTSSQILQKSKINNQSQNYIYEWPYSKVTLDDIKLEMPENIQEQPDIFISLYEYDRQKKQIKSDKRLAFIRIKRTEKSLEEIKNNPKWFKFKPTQPGENLNSQLLCKLTLLNEETALNNPQKTIPRNVKIPYRFKAYIYAGYDFCKNQLHNEVQIQLNFSLNGVEFSVSEIQGRNPVWNQLVEIDLELDEKLEFASNLIINAQNQKKQKQNFLEKLVFSQNQEESLGDSTIQLQQMNTNIEYQSQDYSQFQPKYQFFHLIKNGIPQGRILAAFHLFKIDPFQDNAEKKLTEKRTSLILQKKDFYETQIEMPVIGIRNMPEPMKNPVLTLRIPQPLIYQGKPYFEKKIEFFQDQQILAQNKKNIIDPTFCQIISNVQDDENQKNQNALCYQEEEEKEIDENKKETEINLNNIQNYQINLGLPNSQLLEFTPQAEIELFDQENLNGNRYITSINLIEYYPSKNTQKLSSFYEWFETGKYSYILNQLESENHAELQDKIHPIQNQEAQNQGQPQSQPQGQPQPRNPNLNLNSKENNVLDENFDQEINQEELDQVPDLDEAQKFRNPNFKKKKSFRSSQKQQKQSLQQDQQQQQLQLYTESQAYSSQYLNTSKLSQGSEFYSQNQLVDTDNKSVFSSNNLNQNLNSNYSNNNEQYQNNSQDPQISTSTSFNSNYSIEQPLSIVKTAEETQYELEAKKQNIQQFFNLVNNISKHESQIQKSKYKTEDIRKQILRAIQKLQNKVTQESFLNDNQIEQGYEGVDYGNREVIKDSFDQIQAKNLPYIRYPLTLVKTSQKQINSLNNENSSIILKAHLRLQFLNKPELSRFSVYTSNYSQSSKSQSAVSQTVPNSQSVSNLEKSKNQRKKKQIGLINYTSELDHPQFPFDIFDEKFLNLFNPQESNFNLKVRVYIFRCQNLAAQANMIDKKQFLAGNSAKSSASAYPVIQVGNGDLSNKNITKKINDSKNAKIGTLSPEFYKGYELDAYLPADWRLKITIMNQNQLIDSEIGNFEIDLEDRILSYPDLRQRLVLELLEEDFSEKIESLKFKYDAQSSLLSQNYKNQLNQIHAIQEAMNSEIKLPLEYQELKNSNKPVCQGTVEMILEPFTEKIAQMVPMSYFEAPKPLEFEMRIVIWDAKNLPIPKTHKSVNLMTVVSLDQSATGTNEEIIKETDVHNNSQDGNGQFNWRMVFPFKIPSKFPRLRLQVYDFHVLEGNDLLGETVINLNKIIKKLRTNGKYEIEPQDFKLQHPNFREEERGEVNLSIQIIPKQEADQNKVGEGQNEPNQNPYLEKPKQGRGITDFISGGFNLGLYGALIKKFLKWFLGVLASLLLTIILFVKPGILVK